MSSKKRVSYFYDSTVGAYTYGTGHPMKPARMGITHELIQAYDMLGKMTVLRPKRTTPEAMTAFHTDEYIEFLSKVTPETVDKLTFSGSQFLVGEDNPAFDGIFEFSSISAGGSIGAARQLASGSSDISINWAGGLHHAKKREASGFCYINDIVLGILELLRTFPRVIYIDIDCHHGDGVEEAFYISDRVMTVSFHKYGEFFPGTGTSEDRGRGKGRGYTVNVPLKDGITDQAYSSIFEPIMSKCMEVFRPSAIVLQCGADSLSGDKLGCFNLSMKGHAHCVQFMRKFNVPLILLGGGGYTVRNVARTWAYETACALGIEDTIDEKLPWNGFFEWFGPRYRLEVPTSNMDDENVVDGSLERVKNTVLEQLGELQAAPSVALQDTPRESLATHLRLGKNLPTIPDTDHMDDELAQTARYLYGLQQSEVGSDTDESEDEDGTDSESSNWRRASRSQHRARKRAESRQRMSLLTGHYFTIPDPIVEEFDAGPASVPRRKFFQSSARWGSQDGGVVFYDDWDRKISQSGNLPRVGERKPPVNGRAHDPDDMMDI